MKYSFTLLLLFIATIGRPQDPSIAMDVVASAGGYVFNSTENFSMGWTVGQTVFITLTSSDMIITQGFHQGNLNATAVPLNPPLPDLGLQVYPNPTSDGLFILMSISDADTPSSVEVYDLTGRKILMRDMVFEAHNPSYLPLEHLTPGMYLLRVRVKGHGQWETFKFIKK